MTTSAPRAFLNDSQTAVDRRIFSDPTIYNQELARVFARSWLYLGHESMLQKPGDFTTTYMGADPVILTRQRDGSYRALLNSCRHRGMRVCRYDDGNAKAFTCPYHGWAYGTDGALKSVPLADASYKGRLNTSAWGLAVVPRIETYKGLIFGTWDNDIPPLLEYLGDFTYYLDRFVDPDGNGTEALGGVHKWQMQGNWKLAAEQFVGDMYHGQGTHLSVIIVEADELNGMNFPSAGFQVGLANGHGLGGYDDFPYWDTLQFTDPTRKWLDSFMDRVVARHGSVGRDTTLIHGTIFPNTSFLFPNGNIRVWHPRGADAMEVHSWCLVPTTAPPYVRRDLLLYYQRHFSVSGTWEQDDGEQWHYSTNSADGFIARGLPLNYEMGHGTGSNTNHPEFPGVIDDVFSEMNQRRFYARWEELMAQPHPGESGRTDALVFPHRDPERV